MSNLEKVQDQIKFLEGIAKKNKDNDQMMVDLSKTLQSLNDYLINDYKTKNKPLSTKKDHGMGFDLY